MRRLPARLLLASVVFTLALVLVAVVSIGALRRASGLTQDLARRQVAALEEAERIDDVLIQKGYVSNYLLTHDRRWLNELEQRKKATLDWLRQISSKAATDEQRELAHQLLIAYAGYNTSRDRTLADFEAGRTEAAMLEVAAGSSRMNDVLEIAHALAKTSRSDLLDTINEGDSIFVRTQRWIGLLLLVTTLLSIGFGVWVSQRIARPIYELILQVETAEPGRVRVDTAAEPSDELDRLSQYVRSMLGQLDEQRRRLLQAEKMEALGEIAAKLAHEILNPVAGAKAALQVVMRTSPTLPPDARQTIQEVDRTLSRIDTILSRLVRYARPLEPRRQAVTVDDLVTRALETVKHELLARNVRVVAEVPRLPAVEVDPGLIGQVLTNLLVNAAQASPAGSEVRLVARPTPGGLELSVSDRGHGLPPAREKLFRPFFTTRENGNGLGLATCQNIVAEHGGTIEARDGDDGVGATFRVTLPQRSAEWISPS